MVIKDNIMKITARQLRRIIEEEVAKLSEDSIADELENLRANIRDDEGHIDNLEKDIEDERKEAHRAEEDKDKKEESFRLMGRQLKEIIRSELSQIR